MEKRNTGKWFRHGSWWRRLFLNRRYKDVLFRRLFRDKKDLLDLYNALNGSTYTDFEAVETAMDSCIERGILSDILIREKVEVLHMLLTEYDEKKHLRNTYREGKEEGIKEGLEIGVNKGREEKLREQVQKKLSKGKTLPEIAEELEEDPLVIEQIVSTPTLH